ncbi:MAG: hypothetical protein OQK12_05115 [Motiliproteus sp.]|nr:hypothetical protein [Motiliproteus sp.]MCW9050991.1 hypothetical protein [Motiliproteus sp.]
MKSKLARIDRCELTDHYEVAIVHKTPLHIRLLHQTGEQEQRILPLNLRCQNGKDYLFATDSEGREVHIDVDDITDVREFPL